MTPRSTLEERFAEALRRAGAPEGTPAIVIPATRPEFGDYQVNGVMAAAKKLKANPRQLAEKVLAVADVSDLADPPEIAGPGFINVRLSSDFLAGLLRAALGDAHLGVEKPTRRTVVVDYSSPNLAKEMHVGHLRSTIIGDALARVLEFLGHEVIRQNHVGDWGTQFGMLLAFMDMEQAKRRQQLSQELSDLEEFYRLAKAMFDSDPAFAEQSRQNVVRLQGRDEHCRQVWQRFIEESLGHCEGVYRRLNVTLTRSDVRGESAYNDDLPRVVEELTSRGLLQESQGAQCVFLEEFTNKDGERLPVIVQKSDGAYLYATTDLAAMRYRVNELKADRILYVTDSRQALHFRQVFAVARKAGFVPAGVSLEHVPFGTMQGPDGKPFKTREGGTVKLTALLDESEQRAAAVVEEKNPDLPEQEKKRIAHVVGVAAVKYADLSQNRTSDYLFSWDKMLSLEGNTAPYMQYAYARIRSIFRKGDELTASRAPGGPGRQGADAGAGGPGQAGIRITEPAERSLALKLTQFPEAVESVAAECLPNLLCGYLYELAGRFMGFYEACPVLQSDQPVRAGRLALCELTARTIKTGLGLLGIETIEQM